MLLMNIPDKMLVVIIQFLYSQEDQLIFFTALLSLTALCLSE